MIQAFLESFCFLIWYLARAENDNYEVVEVLRGEPFDLDNFFTCNESWSIDGEEKSIPLVAEANMAAFYKCPSIDKEVFVIVLRKELTLVLESLKSVSHGEMVKLACSVEFNSAGFTFDHYMAIMNSSGIKIAETTEKSSQGRDYEVLLRGEETPSYGLNAYLCVWRYTISKDEKKWPQANFDETNITVEVNNVVDGQVSKEDLGKEIYQETSVDSVIIKTMSIQSTRTVSSSAPKTVKPSAAGASDRVPARSEADSLFQGQSILVTLGFAFIHIHGFCWSRSTISSTFLHRQLLLTVFDFLVY